MNIMETAEWPNSKDMMMKPMEDIIMNSNTCSSSPTSCSNIIASNNNHDDNLKPPSTALERKVRPQKDEAANCPRCNSTNTKFCYYNNYSLTQPRYFCKTCKRYWTEGGSLRNIPVGGGSRKNKRPPSTSSSDSPSSKRISSHDLVAASQSHHMLMHMNMISNPNNNRQDLNLGFPPNHQQFTSLSQYIQLPTMESTPISKDQLQNPTTTTTNTTTNCHRQQLSALELLHGLTSTRGLTPFIPMSMSIPDPDNNSDVYSSGYPGLQDFKPSLNFSLDAHGNGNLHGDEHNSGHDGRMLFPFEDLKQVSSKVDVDADHGDNNNNNNDNDEDEQDRDENGDSGNGYWSGMLGNAGSW